MLEEFKKFALKGNVVDLAVGVIIGAAFGAIVNSHGRRRHHADHRCDHRRSRLLELLHAAVESGARQPIWPTPRSRAPCWHGEASSP